MMLYSRRARAVNPRGVGIRELFRRDPEIIRDWMKNATGHWIAEGLIHLDKVLRVIEPPVHWLFQKKAEAWALNFIEERLNGRDGLGAIYPAMANTLMIYHTLGMPKDDPKYKIVRESIDLLVVTKGDEEYVQPCVSPVWDTCLASHAMQEAGLTGDDPEVAKSNAWLRDRQVLDVVGDWAHNRGHLRPGGWAFQYNNDHYPDVDDTAVVVMALARSKEDEANREAIARAEEWIIGMQSSNGGWGAFDAENEHEFLNHIPFADHGALLDPPTVDVSARCIGMLAQLGRGKQDPVVAKGLNYLWSEQEPDGSWFGRWGTNYIYGTWSALNAFNAVDWDMTDPRIQKAVAWLKARQRADGGWGEDCATYWKERKGEAKGSTPSQTAWALLGLMAAGEVDSPEVARGIDYLMTAPREGGKWEEELYNAVGFPRIFYLRYHGYSAYFPLWALSRYRNLTSGNSKRTIHGM
jgi:squalene-hopene/tetraprenyl-beta-curcumene cyclase